MLSFSELVSAFQTCCTIQLSSPTESECVCEIVSSFEAINV